MNNDVVNYHYLSMKMYVLFAMFCESMQVK